MPRKKSLLTPAKQFINKNKNSIKFILTVIINLIVMYWMIRLLTPKPQIPVEYKTEIDALNKSNIDLINKQKQIDSIILSYQKQIINLDSTISNIELKKIIINKHYHNDIKKVDSFTPTQIDTFFKKRYNY